MSKIRVKNFGPIKNGFTENEGWIDIKKVTLFIGNQGTGKSSIAKLISTFTWIEKALTRGDYSVEYFEKPGTLKEYLEYHNISGYFKGTTGGLSDWLNEKPVPETELEYQGNSYSIKYYGGRLFIKKSTTAHYHLPQIMYVPAERNVNSYSQDFRRSRTLPGSLIELMVQFNEAARRIENSIKLPINNLSLDYYQNHDTLTLSGDDYTIGLHEASSGIQSLVPLYLVSRHFANSVKELSENREPMSSEEQIRFRNEVSQVHANRDLTEEQRRAALSVIASKYNKTAFINIVEEPEQNLFPTSQWQILKSLLEFNNMSEGNELIMTTHSPYVINYLTVAAKAWNVYNKIRECGKEQLLSQIEDIISAKSAVHSDDLVIYELDEMGGISKLGNYKGLPSDENYLNDMLEKSNSLYSQLLDIEDQCL